MKKKKEHVTTTSAPKDNKNGSTNVKTQKLSMIYQLNDTKLCADLFLKSDFLTLVPKEIIDEIGKEDMHYN